MSYLFRNVNESNIDNYKLLFSTCNKNQLKIMKNQYSNIKYNSTINNSNNTNNSNNDNNNDNNNDDDKIYTGSMSSQCGSYIP